MNKYQDLDPLFELVIFQGYKKLVFYWDFSKGMVYDKLSLDELLKQNRLQNIYGVSEGLKGFSQAFSSEPITNFRYLITNYFRYSIFEMCSGVKIILLSNVSEQVDYSETLKEVYFKCYLEVIQRNPFYQNGEPLDNPFFIEKLSELFEPYLKRK